MAKFMPASPIQHPKRLPFTMLNVEVEQSNESSAGAAVAAAPLLIESSLRFSAWSGPFNQVNQAKFPAHPPQLQQQQWSLSPLV